MTLKIEFYDVGEHEHRPYAASAQLLASLKCPKEDKVSVSNCKVIMHLCLPIELFIYSNHRQMSTTKCAGQLQRKQHKVRSSDHQQYRQQTKPFTTVPEVSRLIDLLQAWAEILSRSSHLILDALRTQTISTVLAVFLWRDHIRC